uniref:Uncharacterized protein n=1 Tax=Anguilla anguilla TaxID=7936 RepID=A0A0E9VDY0_ANGAN
MGHTVRLCVDYFQNNLVPWSGLRWIASGPEVHAVGAL